MSPVYPDIVHKILHILVSQRNVGHVGLAVEVRVKERVHLVYKQDSLILLRNQRHLYIAVFLVVHQNVLYCLPEVEGRTVADPLNKLRKVAIGDPFLYVKLFE